MPEWVTETGIPCFRPHKRRDKEGNVLYEVTAADIPEVAKNSARVTVELHGNKPPITEGHRNFAENAKEADQPLVLGYLDNFRTGQLPDGTPCVLCDRHYMAQHADRAKRHPFPSVDYIHALKAIVGLAKLTRPPALNLGGVYYPGTQHPVYVYSLGDDKVDDQNPKPTPDATATPELTPEEQAGSEKVYKYLLGKYKWMATCAQKYDAAPQGNNTNVPDDGDKRPEKKDDEDKPVSNAANVELVQKYEATQAQLAKLMAEREGEKVDRLLDGLEKVERYQFDRPAEREAMLALSEADRLKRCDSIRKYHHRLPGAERIDVYSGNAEGPEPETSRDVANAAVRYASKHGVSYDDGLAAVKAGKK